MELVKSESIRTHRSISSSNWSMPYLAFHMEANLHTEIKSTSNTAALTTVGANRSLQSNSKFLVNERLATMVSVYVYTSRRKTHLLVSPHIISKHSQDRTRHGPSHLGRLRAGAQRGREYARPSSVSGTYGVSSYSEWGDPTTWYTSPCTNWTPSDILADEAVMPFVLDIRTSWVILGLRHLHHPDPDSSQT